MGGKQSQAAISERSALSTSVCSESNKHGFGCPTPSRLGQRVGAFGSSTLEFCCKLDTTYTSVSISIAIHLSLFLVSRDVSEIQKGRDYSTEKNQAPALSAPRVCRPDHGRPTFRERRQSEIGHGYDPRHRPRQQSGRHRGIERELENHETDVAREVDVSELSPHLCGPRRLKTGGFTYSGRRSRR